MRQQAWHSTQHIIFIVLLDGGCQSAIGSTFPALHIISCYFTLHIIHNDSSNEKSSLQNELLHLETTQHIHPLLKIVTVWRLAPSASAWSSTLQTSIDVQEETKFTQRD
jgi:hypothetical protein